MKVINIASEIQFFDKDGTKIKLNSEALYVREIHNYKTEYNSQFVLSRGKKKKGWIKIEVLWMVIYGMYQLCFV